VSRKRLGKNKRNRQSEQRRHHQRANGVAAALPDRADKGRYEIVGRWPILALAAVTWLLSLPLFEPFSWWPFGFIVCVPWLLAVCAARNARWVYIASYLLGSAFFLTHFRWLYSTTAEGYVAASLYLAVYFPLAAWPIRHLCRRRGLSVALVFPIVWVAVELLRSRGPLGFPWFLLGHSQIRLLTMIQIADLAGAFGVSFVLAMVNGWFVDLKLRVIPRWLGSSRPIEKTVWRWGVVTAALLLATIVYGRYRLGSQVLVEGPRISVVQGDFLLETVRGYNGASPEQKMLTYLRQATQASGDSPDMIVLPETPWAMLLNKEARAADPELLEPWNGLFVRRAKQYGAYVTVGAMSEEPQPPGTYPKEHRYNSAFVYAPGESEPMRYNKIHLVPFGEFVPFRYSKRFFWLYHFLNDSEFNYFGRGGYEYSLTPGDDFTVFKMRSRLLDPQVFRFGITICYEDVIPQIFRRFVTDEQGEKRVDFMLNISNDGWFGRGTQQPQHLVNCAFRAVENRVAVARSVNTGVSGFIRPDGSWHDLMSEPGKRPRAGGMGHRTAQLKIDPRVSFYSCYGDLFAGLCALLTLVGLADAIGYRWKSKVRS